MSVVGSSLQQLGVEPDERPLFGWAGLCLLLMGAAALGLLNTAEPLPPGRVRCGPACQALEKLLGRGSELPAEERADLLQVYARLTGGEAGGQELSRRSAALLDRAMGDRSAAVRLQGVTIFDRLSTQQLVHLAEALQERQVEGGEALAKGGEVWICPDTHRAIADLVHTNLEQQAELPGTDGPMALRLVLGVGGAHLISLRSPRRAR